MRRRDPHIYDEQYDGVLSAMSLSGGVATADQLAEWLGGRTAARALMQTVVERRLGSRVALPAAPALALRRTTMRLLTGRDSPRPVLSRARFTAVHRFEHHLREGRPLHPTHWVPPTLFARGRLRHPEVADAVWVSLGRVDCVFVDLDPEGSRIAVVDRTLPGRQYRRLFDTVGIVGNLVGRPVELRIVCGTPAQVMRIDRLLASMDGHPPGVIWSLVEYDIGAAFASPDDSPTTPIPALEPEPGDTVDMAP